MDPEAQLAQLRAAAAMRAAAPPSPGCPEATVWEEVCVGAREAEEASRLLRHAASCGHCSVQLRLTTETAGAGIVDEADIASGIAELPSSRPRGRQDLARRLQRMMGAGPSTAAPRAHAKAVAAAPRRSWIYAATLAAAAVVVLAVWVPGAGRALLVQRLLARAYAQHRTLPLRFAGADYGPLLSARRGGSAGPDADLLEAEGLVASGLEQHPHDIRLLEAQARAELMAGNAAAALADLQRGLLTQAEPPTQAQLEIDLASAYYEQAEAGHDAAYGSALEYLGRALAIAPRDPVALYNRAWVEEALENWTGAIADWTVYLKVDADGSWAAEARQHLAADQKLVASHDAAVAAPLLSPAEFARLGAVDADTDARIEDYLMAATASWLPAAYPLAGAGDPATAAGLRRLARQLEQAHHDVWLSQLLRQATRQPVAGDARRSRAGARAKRPFAQAVALLSTAVTDNAQGRPDAALAAARQAEVQFAQAASPAGRARAAYEAVYALFRAEHGPQCLAALQPLVPAPARPGYGWIEGEAWLEHSDCVGMQGGDGQADVARAVALGRADRYPSLLMRALSFQAAGQQAQDSARGWRMQRQQLALYWQARVGPYRAYQLNMMLAFYASQRREWFAAERLAQAAIERVALTPEHSYEAMGRQALADFAAQCGFTEESRAQFARADALFAALPPTATTANLRAFNQIEEATIETAEGHPARARAQLAAYRRAQPPVVSLDARALPYFALLGQWELAQGQAAAAELDERAAIAIDENDLRQLGDDSDRLDWQQRTRDAYRAWVEIVWELHHDPARALEYWEWAKGQTVRASRPLPPGFIVAAERFDAAAAPPLPEPDQVRNLLPGLRQEQIVSYAFLPRGLAIWIFDNRGVHGVRVAVEAAPMEGAAQAFAHACADPASDPALLEAEGRQLYQWLLQPVSAWLDASRVLVVEPDGALDEVPFAALVPPGGGYLPQPVVRSPGIEYARLARPPLASWNRARLVAVASAEAGRDENGEAYPPLPETEHEAAAAVADFPSGSRMLADEAATPAAVRAALAQAEIFHFAGHAEAGRLLLANGASLTAADFSPSALPHCELAVLAACSTGAGAALTDPEGLVRALLRAGVPSVVATRWQVDSAASRQFSQVFYAALRGGRSVPRALQTAQLRLRQQPATAAPFYWAAFAAFAARP